MEPRFLLETKFYPPRPPRDLVRRPRLRDSLVRGTTSKLMLVSAPVGFGKSTVLAQWLDEWGLVAVEEPRSVAYFPPAVGSLRRGGYDLAGVMQAHEVVSNFDFHGRLLARPRSRGSQFGEPPCSGSLRRCPTASGRCCWW